MTDPRERHRWHDGHNYRVLSDGTFQGKSPGDPEDKWQPMEGWQSPTMGREIGRLTEIAKAAEALENRLTLVHASPEYEGVWALYRVHGGEYRGPFYIKEYHDLAAALWGDDDPRVKSLRGAIQSAGEEHRLVHHEHDPHCVVCGLAKMAEGRRG